MLDGGSRYLGNIGTYLSKIKRYEVDAHRFENITSEIVPINIILFVTVIISVRIWL